MTWRGVLAYFKAFGAAPLFFLFPLGAVVAWRGSPEAAQPWTIAARRYTNGEVSDYVEYLLVSQGTPETPTEWAYEPDIEEVA